MGTLFMFVIAFSFGVLVNGNAQSSSMYENFEIFSSVFQSIRAYYYDASKVDPKELIHGGIRGMLNSLDDEHSTFMDPAQIRNLREDTRGEFGGLGIMIGLRNKRLTVISPIRDTPAWKEHLQAGDVITHINGKSTKGITLLEAVSKLRGRIGTKARIKIAREGRDDLFEVTIVRARIQIETVKYKYLKADRIGYIRISQFSRNSATLLRKAVSSFRKKGHMRGLIIDLRNNPGGLLSAAFDTSNLFLSRGLIVYTKGRDISQAQRFRADRFSTVIPENIPMVVLVNRGSASASEIFAGAMQDTGRAVLIGEKTYGKGSVQSLLPLSDGSSLKLTVALYYTPSGRQIHNKGLQPDIKITISEYSKAQQKSLAELINKRYLALFLKKYRAYSARDLSAFMARMREKGIMLPRHEIERWLYWEKSKIGKQPIVNLKFDRPLREAASMIRRGMIKVQSLEIYQDIK